MNPVDGSESVFRRTDNPNTLRMEFRDKEGEERSILVNREAWMIVSESDLNGWFPIKDAPRDGRTVLLHHQSDDPEYEAKNKLHPEDTGCDSINTVVAAWWGEPDSGEWVCYMDMTEDPSCPFEPTHYRPMMKPPFRKCEGF